MRFEIYPADFSTRYELSNAISVSQSYYYNDIGKIQIVAVANDYNIAMLKQGAMIYDVIHRMCYVVCAVNCDTTNNQITANGYTAEWMMNHRCVAEKIVVSNVEQGCYALVSANLRGLPRMGVASQKGFSETLESPTEMHGKYLLDTVDSLLQSVELGRYVVWNPATKQYLFEIYKGNDFTHGIHAVAFVEEQGTCSDLVINIDNSLVKNVAYIRYELTDGTVIQEAIGDTSAEDRREYWMESVVKQSKEETAEECRQRAIGEAMIQLAKRTARDNFDVTIPPDELDTRFSVGDKILCTSNRFGVSFSARITGVSYTLDATGEKVAIILGNKNATIKEELMLNGN